jgi:hypothetical protein
MCAREEVAELHEFAVRFVFDVDDAPFVGAGADYFAVYGHCLFGADDCEGDAVLDVRAVLNNTWKVSNSGWRREKGEADLDLGVEGAFFFVEFVVVVGVHFKVMEGEFCFDLLLIKGPGRSTLCLKAWRSARVRESDLAMTGTTLTTSDNFFRTTISMGLRLMSEYA